MLAGQPSFAGAPLIGRTWAQACLVAAAWVLGLGAAAFLTAVIYGGGF